jgi:DNA ligase-1
VHKSGDARRVYTRNLNDVTAAVPEVINILKNVKAESLILDGEASRCGPPAAASFQLTTPLRRKLDVERCAASCRSVFRLPVR